jgi:uncharacterized protein YndB with AHSA1/START domain
MQGDLRPETGHRFQFRADWGHVACEVLEVEPERAIAYSWNAGPLRSVVRWTLSPAPDGGTSLRLEQTGFTEGQDQFFNGAQDGWPRFLDNLEGVLGQDSQASR